MRNADAWAGAALPIAAAVLLLIAIVRSRAARYGRVIREGGTAFLSERIMHLGYAWIDAVANGIARAGVSANAVSWTSLVLGAAAGILAGAGWLGVGAWALALSSVCDGIDGAVARRHGSGTPAGAVLDSALDRYVEFFFFAGLLVYFRTQWPLQLLAATALFGGFMVTYSTAKAEALHVIPPRGWMKRPERLVWLIGGAALAAAGALGAIRPDPVVGSVLAVIAVFANVSAVLRLRAVAATVAAKNPNGQPRA